MSDRMSLDHALETIAGMKIEWGVKDLWGDFVWFIPTDYVDVDDEGSKRMAEEYAASDEGFQLIHRYVTGVIAGE